MGCDLDKLEWNHVYDLLHRVFNTNDVFYVYEYKATQYNCRK